jgi:hypothetical protein
MGLKLTIPVENAVKAMDFKAQVHCICKPSDYTWRYTPPVNNWLGDEVLTPGTVVFEFADEQMATYFQLKWAQ